MPGATLLLNSPYGADEVWQHLPKTVQQDLIDKKIKFYVIDAAKVARDSGMGTRTNTIMQTCFFAISGVMPKDTAIEKIKYSIRKTYGKKGEEIVRKNFEAVDYTVANLQRGEGSGRATSVIEMLRVVPAAGAGVRAEGHGDDDGGPRRRTAGQRAADRRHLSERHDEVGEAQHLAVRAGVGAGDLHPVRQLQLRLPARRDPLQALRQGAAGRTRRRVSSRRRSTPAASPTPATPCRSTPRTAPAATLCVEVCPAKSKEETGKKAINMAWKEPILESAKARRRLLRDACR